MIKFKEKQDIYIYIERERERERERLKLMFELHDVSSISTIFRHKSHGRKR